MSRAVSIRMAPIVLASPRRVRQRAQKRGLAYVACMGVDVPTPSGVGGLRLFAL